jgi:hypothetical protein
MSGEFFVVSWACEETRPTACLAKLAVDVLTTGL